MSDANSTYVEWKDWAADGFGRFDAIDAAYFEAETGITRGTAARVLEIGFGNGAFLGWARAGGAAVYGIEINQHLRDRAAAMFGAQQVFADLHALREMEGQFTHIVAFDVIEHMSADELRAALRGARQLLAAGGRLILRFPNGDSPFGRVSQHGDPTHVQTIGRQKLEYFAHEAGLSVAAIRAPALPGSGVGVGRALRRTAVKAVRVVVERIVAVLYFGGRRIPLDPNYVAVLMRPA